MATNTKTRNHTTTATADAKASTGKPGNGTSEKAAKIARLPRERVAAVLAGKPDGATAREIAGETKLAQSTVTTALKALKQDGTVVCLPGRSKDNPRTADVWRTATTTGTPGPGSDEPTGSSPEPV